MTRSKVTTLAIVAALVVALLVVALLGVGRLAVGQEADPVFVGAGDIASCASSGDEATANLLDGIPGTVYTLGDNVYDSGTDAEFADCYNSSWGRHKARTRPIVGNHEYRTPGASGYFKYFGAAAGESSKGYYSYDLGAWHIVALNSMCQNVGGCGATSPMVTWLKGDLATNPSSCTLAYWHHPVFSSGAEHGNNPKMIPSWDALYAAGADVVLSGHDHDYERFAPQTSSGVADPDRGIREFVVGTGGKSHLPTSARSAPTARSGTPTPTGSSSSRFMPQATIGSSCPKRARPLLTLAAAAATMRPLRALTVRVRRASQKPTLALTPPE